MSRSLAARALRRGWKEIRKATGTYRAPSHQEAAVVEAAHLCDLRGAKILVVGANTGHDCRLFVERGAAEVHGLDVIEEIGRDYTHPRVTYHRAGIERTGLPGNSFDLVFSVATMEHVAGIEAGFLEMERLARPGGFIYSIASPLYNSRYGHHMGCFAEHPWIHLCFEREELIAYASAHGITGDNGVPLQHVVTYMLHPDFFNKRKSADYVAACQKMSDCVLLENRLSQEPRSLLKHELGRRALAAGYDQSDLLARDHLLIAKKRK